MTIRNRLYFYPYVNMYISFLLKLGGFFCLFFVFVLCLVDPMLPVSQDCPFFIIPSQLYFQCYRPYNKLNSFNFNVTLVLYYMLYISRKSKLFCVVCMRRFFALCFGSALGCFFFFFLNGLYYLYYFFCLSSFCVLHPMVPVSLNCPFFYLCAIC